MTAVYEAARILDDTTNPYEFNKTCLILEDSTSPISKKYQEKLYQSVIDKSHINFGDIPKSAGNIKQYSGYAHMMETLKVMEGLASEQKKSNVLEYINIIKTAIANIEMCAPSYAKGFSANSDYVMLEYNVYVYTCVQATTTLLYDFVDYIKRPDQQVFTIQLKDTKNRADLFYFEQLKKYNNVIKNMGIDYRKMLDTMANKGKQNFIGTAEVVGIATISLVLYSIIPITRELVYQFYHIRSDLTNCLEMQAMFLEMNKAAVEGNTEFTVEKKKAVLAKQEKLRKSLLSLADKIRVNQSKAMIDSRKEIAKDNKLLTIDDIKSEISNSPMEIF